MSFKITAKSRSRRMAASALQFGLPAICILLLSGCSDLFSIQPLGTVETIVFEPALLGEWSSTSRGSSGPQGRDIDGSVQFRAGEAGKKEYDIIWTPDQGESLRLWGQLVRVGGRQVLDLVAVKESNWAIPGHFFMLVENIPGETRLHWLDSDWLRRQIMSPTTLAHAMFDDKPVITAGGAEINAFLAKYGLDPQAVSQTATLRKVKPGVSTFVTYEAPESAAGEAQSLSGIWTGDDGGTYRIQQRGNEIWWYGQSADGGKHWQHVFHGEMKEPGVFEGSWTDLPPGEVQGNGLLSLRFDGKTLQRTAATGGFLGSQWYRGGSVAFCRSDLGDPDE